MNTYKLDPSHSYVGFKVKHMMITYVNGNFTEFDIKMTSPTDNICDANIDFYCNTNSISTNIKDRDDHLKSDDFFDCEKYPSLIFKSKNIEKSDENKYKIGGDLTIKNITLPIYLDCKYNGSNVDIYNKTKYGFELFGKINRNDFGLAFNKLNGKCDVMVDDEIKLIINIQMIKNG